VETDNIVGRIDRAIEATGAVVAAIGLAQLDLPTPCTGWDVRDVLNHLVGGMRIFAAVVTDVGPGGEHEDDWLGEDPWMAYAMAADLDRKAWRSPGALDGTVTISLGTLPGPMAAVIHLTEVLVHGLDLAVAIGREDLADERASLQLLDTMAGMGGVDPYRVPGVFGPELAVPPGAPAHRRLLAYLGRAQ
jgi:uncharacterized protein (TIGR03086 family)